MPNETVAHDIEMTVKRWRKKRGNLIMILHDLQDKYGFVPREASLELSKQMNVPLARIYEVLTFYNYFKLEPPGKYVISVCLGTACYLKGAGEILEEFGNQLGIEVGMTTSDKLFHLQAVRCLGCCGLAPVVMINGKIYSKVTVRGVADIIDTIRKTEEQTSAAV